MQSPGHRCRTTCRGVPWRPSPSATALTGSLHTGPAVHHEGQWLSAFAAREREVRAAIFRRGPRCRPGIGGNKVRRGVQALAGIHHTSRTGADARFGSRWCSLPQRTMAVAHVPLSSGVRRTCFLNAGVHDEDDGFQRDGAAFTRSLERRHRHRTRYRDVNRASAAMGCRDDDRRRERSDWHSCEARCRTHRRLHRHGR